MNWMKKILVPVVLLMTLFLTAQERENKEDLKSKNKKKVTVYKIKKPLEMVVTGTPHPRALKDCSSALHILGKRDLQMLSGANALGVLDYFSAVQVQRTGDFGRADVNIRGLGNNCRQIAVLVDGKPEKMGLFGCAVSHAFPLDNVERIEVIKGPASVLYGGEALGGVINILTGYPEKRNETDLSINLGSFDTRLINLKQRGLLGRIGYSFSMDHRGSDGHLPHSEYQGTSLSGSLDYNLSDQSKIKISTKYFSGEKHEPGTVDHPVKGLWNEYKRGFVDIGYIRSMKASDLSVRLFHNFGDHRFSDGWDSTDHTTGTMVRYTLRALRSNVITLGADFKTFGGVSKGWPSGQWDKNEGSVYLHDSYMINDSWVINSGVRLQLDSLFGQEISPQLGCVWHLNDLFSVRAEITKGFRSPQLNELFMFPAANADLQPERVWNYELGFRYVILKGIFLEGSIFQMEGSNMIQMFPNPDLIPAFIFSNTGEFTFWGVDLELSAQLLRYLNLGISCSLTDYGNLTRGRSGQKVNFNLAYRTSKFSAMLTGRYISDYFAADFSGQKIEDYFVLNSRLMVQIGKKLSLFADLNNIFNSDYQVFGEFPGMSAGLYQMPGRFIQIGFKVSIHSEN